MKYIIKIILYIALVLFIFTYYCFYIILYYIWNLSEPKSLYELFPMINYSYYRYWHKPHLGKYKELVYIRKECKNIKEFMHKLYSTYIDKDKILHRYDISNSNEFTFDEMNRK